MENVAGQLDVVECRTAQPCQPRHQRLGRIEGSAGKRAEAGDENAEFVAQVDQALRPSCPRKRASSKRRRVCDPQLSLWNTGSSAFADDDTFMLARSSSLTSASPRSAPPPAPA